MSSVKKQLLKSSAPTFSDTTATGWVITVEDGANYSISVGGGNDVITLSAVNDSLTGNDTVLAGAGNDTLLAYSGTNFGSYESLSGGAGGDSMVAGGGDGHTLDGGDGNDKILGFSPTSKSSGSGLDLEGGAGNDSIVAGAGSNDTLLAYADASHFGTHDQLYGGLGNDSLVAGGGNANSLYGGDGNDKLLAGTITSSSQYQMSAVGVYLDGGDGNDTTFGGFGADTVLGGAGADYINYSGSGGLLDGGSGVDTLDLGGYAYGFHVVGADTAPGSTYFTGIGYSKTVTEGTFSFKNFEVLIGSAYADTVAAVAGLDTIVAGQGNDYVYANGDGESLAGGTGNDTLDFSTPVNAANIDLAAGTATIAGNTVSFSGFESIIGTRADDLFIYTMNPSNSNESIAGGTAGNDTLKLFKTKTTHYVMGTSIGSGVDFVIKYDDGSAVPAATHDSTGNYSLTNSHAGTITFSDNHTLHFDASIEHIAW